MFFQKEIETMPRKEIEALQLQKLKKMVSYCYNNIPFYHERLTQCGVLDGSRIKTLSDISYIPYTTKEDIRDHYPFEMLAVPMREIVRIHASSGTTGKPTVGVYTKRDIDIWSDCVARVAVAGGATADDIIQISFGYGLFTGALGLHYGLEKLGATVIPASSGNTERQLMMLRDFGVTGLVATPSYALYLSEAVKEAGYPLSDYSLRLGILGSEPCTPEMRAQIEKNLHVFVSDNYGLTEIGGPGVSGDCPQRQGMHFAEDHFLPEIIDKDTGQVLAEGQVGELVVTTLSREGMPVLRYRTKDITKLTYAPCACGRTHARMAKTMGRTDDMLIIKGVNVFPTQIESVLVGMEGIGPHYQLVVRRANYKDNLEVKVELTSGKLLVDFRELEALQKRIHDKLKSVLGLETKVTLVEPKTLERFQGKAKRILDLRNAQT
ncbi:MAG: phenylacetate--CoA ligase [Acutalibacteraceae bacterium]|nr:phenylacetate--CoA ligase [Acutalibacteraceae bacterium]